MFVAFTKTFIFTGLVALTVVLLNDTESQLVLLAGLVEKLKGIGVELVVVRPTLVDWLWPVMDVNVTGFGLATITPDVPPPPPPPPGVNVTGTLTSVPPPADVGWSVKDPLQ